MREEIVHGLLQRMKQLAVPVPPTLEAALGYDRPAELASRFVAFYWTPADDELHWDDGYTTSLANWTNWLSYTEHPWVASHLHGLHFGGAEAVASHYFLLDRVQRRAYAAQLLDVMRLLALQCTEVAGTALAVDGTDDIGAGDLAGKTLSELFNALDAVSAHEDPQSLRNPPPGVIEIQRRLAGQRRLGEAMLRWLDGLKGTDEVGTDERGQIGL